jgi:hypothetical protein
MSITKGFRCFVVVGLLLAVAAASSSGADTNPSSDPSLDRPSTVVVSVPDGGFHWADAGVGAAAALAMTLLALGLVLALRPDRGRTLAAAPRTTTAHTDEEEKSRRNHFEL